jgi:DNA-binding XRE family transcriptional regulator
MMRALRGFTPQQTAAVTTPAPAMAFEQTIIPQGEGSYLVKAGRPVAKLRPQDFARELGVNRQTIYRWKDEGLIPESLIEFAGKRKILILAAAVPVMKAYFKAMRDVSGAEPLYRSGSMAARLVGTAEGFVIARPDEGKPFLVQKAVWDREWKPASNRTEEE